MEFSRFNVLRRHTTATESKQIDLPIDPISHLIVSIDGYNVTDESTLAEILGFVNNINVSRMGKTIFDLESEDIYALNCYIQGKQPMLTAKLETDNLNRTLALVIPFGRKLFDPNECLPGTKKGELTLTLDTTVPATTFDNSTINVQAVTIPGATPKQHLKMTHRGLSAPGSTGVHQIDVPIGNQIAMIGFRLTTFPAASSHTWGIDNFSILKNNKEAHFISSDIMALLADMSKYTVNQLGTLAAQTAYVPDNTIFLDFDPDKDGKWLLETKGLSSCVVEADYGVDEIQVIYFAELESN